MVGSRSFFSRPHCRGACSSRENPGRASCTATEAEEEEDATDSLEAIGTGREEVHTHRDDNGTG